MSSQNWRFLTPSRLLIVFLLCKIRNFWPPPPYWDGIVYERPLYLYMKHNLELKNSLRWFSVWYRLYCIQESQENMSVLPFFLAQTGSKVVITSCGDSWLNLYGVFDGKSFDRVFSQMETYWLSTRTTDTRWLNPQFFAVQIQIPIPNKYLGFEYKGLVFL